MPQPPPLRTSPSHPDDRLDSPVPDSLPAWLHWLPTCPSTNSWALLHPDQFTHGDVVFTRLQTAGRGQFNRTWYAPPGVLTASFILDAVPLALLPTLSLTAGLAVIYAVESLLPELFHSLQLKWPNDVLIHHRKLAGILCESASGAVAQARIVVGIGLNRAVDFTAHPLPIGSNPSPISLQQVAHSVPEELPLLSCLRNHLLQLTHQLIYLHQKSGTSFAPFLPAFNQRHVLLNRWITVQLPSGRVCSGRVLGLDATGRLLLQLPNLEVLCLTSAHLVQW